MANVIRSAKSSSKWNDNDLIAYNITITAVPSHHFFPQGTNVPLTTTGLDPALATANADVRHVPFSSVSLRGHQTNSWRGCSSARIDEFARLVLTTVGFDECLHSMLTVRSIPLLICDEIRKVELINLRLNFFESEMILLLQMNKTRMGRSNVEARIIAGAIAAYQFNNNRRQEMGLRPLDAMTMPCITMVGVRPTFYLVPVTKALSDAVISSQYPSGRTEVLTCEVASDHDKDMEEPKYRGVALQYYVAFKSLAKSHWEKFIV
ncbi:hypothetical protein BD769DRAFT_1355695 [Suillus cothurnatus]|nr:hypothetical protein BD769DRAFT_1355695 [Suillus cothurnatus]